jgi:DNA-binding response OmpR family regulator
MENPSILIIERDSEIRKLLRNSLSAEQYLLRESMSAGDGLGQCTAAKPDLVLLDPIMPDMDGIDVIRHIRWRKNHCPIIVLSTQTDEVHRWNADRVVTHRQLLEEVWGGNEKKGPHYLRVYMGQLRKKPESDPSSPRHLLTKPRHRLSISDGKLRLIPSSALGQIPQPPFVFMIGERMISLTKRRRSDRRNCK